MAQPNESSLTDIKSPPVVPGWPWVRNLPDLSIKHLQFMLQARANHGDVFTVNFGGTDFVMLGRPEYAQHVLVDHSAAYQDKGKPSGFRLSPAPMMGAGVAMVRGKDDSWRKQRRALQPNFQANKLENMTVAMIDVIDAELERWDAYACTARPIDVERALTRMLLRVVGRTMFGIQMDDDTADELAASVRTVNDYIWWANLKVLLPDWIPLPGETAYRAALSSIRSCVERIVKASLADQESDHLLNTMRRHLAEDLDQSALSAAIHNEAITILVTGYESSAASLAWAFDLLARHQDEQVTLHKEIDEVLEQRKPTPDDVPSLAYARMVFQETLRLYPPSYWGAQRLCSETDEIGGYRIDPGMIVMPVQYLSHYHPEIWENPSHFDPQRFTKDKVASRHGLAWMPFGAGQRKCLAQEFALINGQVVLAQVLQRFRVEKIAGRSPQLIVTSNLRPKGVWLTLRNRHENRATAT